LLAWGSAAPLRAGPWWCRLLAAVAVAVGGAVEAFGVRVLRGVRTTVAFVDVVFKGLKEELAFVDPGLSRRPAGRRKPIALDDAQAPAPNFFQILLNFLGLFKCVVLPKALELDFLDELGL